MSKPMYTVDEMNAVIKDRDDWKARALAAEGEVERVRVMARDVLEHDHRCSSAGGCVLAALSSLQTELSATLDREEAREVEAEQARASLGAMTARVARVRGICDDTIGSTCDNDYEIGQCDALERVYAALDADATDVVRVVVTDGKRLLRDGEWVGSFDPLMEHNGVMGGFCEEGDTLLIVKVKP